MPGKQHFDSFIWVRSIKEYTSRKKIDKRTIFLIKPSDMHVQREREKILKWYGLEAASIAKSLEEVQTLPKMEDSTNPVICIGKEYVALCKQYCILTDRPFINLNSTDLIYSLEDKKFTSFLFVGTEKHFKEGIVRINQTIQKPWGFVSGKNVADVSFFITKMLISAAASKQNDQNLLLNVIGRQVIISKGDNNLAAFTFNKKTLDVLLKRNWQNLSLYAHGEISHMLLNSWVICGRNEQLKKPYKDFTESCTEENSRRLCIRVHNKNISIIYAGELKTCHLQLFSCTSLNFSPKLTPQHISLFQSIVKGYCASAVMTNRNVVVTEELIKLTHTLNCKGVSKSFIITLLNDYEEHFNHDRPYVLVGDPECKNKIVTRKLETGKPIEGKKQQVHVFKLNSVAKQQIIRLQGKEKNIVVRGKRYLTVCFENDDPSFFRFEFKRQEFLFAKSFFKAVSLSYNIFRFLEENLDALLQQHPKINNTCREVGNLLKDYSGKIKTIIDKGFLLLESVQAQGVWHEAIARHTKLLKSYIDQWQSGFSLLLNEPSLFAYFGNLLSSSMIEEQMIRQFNCDYCGGVLKTYKMNQLRQRITLDKIWCDLCGLRQLSIPVNSCFSIVHTKKMIPGATIPVTVKLNSALLSEDEEPLPLHVIISLYNKSQEKEVYREYIRTTGKEVSVLLKIPSKISYDLHVLGVVCLWAPYIQYYRSRISTMF